MSACIRLSEVEAAHDGRLALDAEHLAGCAQCSAEAASLALLSSSLGALRTSSSDAAALARAREVVLTTALVPKRTIAWPRLAVAALIAVLATGSLLAFKASVPAAATRIQAIDEGEARWTIDSRDDSENITLTEGTLQLSITRPTNGKQVIVHVPDGTIEDIGTVFHVMVSNGATQEVRVDQGAVRLTLKHFGLVELRAGEHWSRSEQRSSVGSSMAAPPTEPAPVVVPAADPVTPKTIRRTPGPAPKIEADDSEGEDAAYLSVMRSVREGSLDETAAAAKNYLEKYPSGFRAREVQRLLH